ncbi:5-formyltetrahydrofolate cyclo-ligase [Paracoccus sp. Z330]|uniref:5-formyltetrahydrofolate cyclo-ligase n=1 Tax=Paracoccus onchidii TaxID=3017813 RepID=A0ABT4ZFE5_9RHOB|nr:5-formyltetrahydrofolate cyclo-ligase [Paracoccus onchidii]MDB6178068.1 5-formyltetrahydrofolate cyclo-ligase [Paracoccus onchidii]
MTGQAKSLLRKEALAKRLRLAGDQDAIHRMLRRALGPFREHVLAGYWPMRGEADPRAAMAEHSGPTCLPVVTGRAVPLVFRAWTGGALVAGPFGTSHPPESAAPLVPNVLIVPLAGFDRRGNRIGYGGGYYDRTLELLRKSGGVQAIGLAFSSQELSEIPAERFDQPLDQIVTDREIITANP